MPLAINSVTGHIHDYPLNIINHRRLGKNLELYVEEGAVGGVEVAEKRVYKKKSEAQAEDESTTTEESPVTNYFYEVGE